MFHLLFGLCQCAVARDGKEQQDGKDGKSTGQTNIMFITMCLFKIVKATTYKISKDPKIWTAPGNS